MVFFRSVFFSTALASSTRFLRCSRINDLRIQYLSGRIHNSKLTAGTKRRIPAEHYMSGDGRLHQKLF